MKPKRTSRRKSIREEMRVRAHRAFHPPPEQPPPPKDALYLGRHPVTGEYVYILPSDLDTHVEFVGGSRRGKTNALRRLVKVLLRRKRERGEGLSIVDPHGGLAQYALELCAADKDISPDDVIYLTLQDVEHALSINPVRRTGKDSYYQAACVREALIKIFDQARSQDLKLVSRVLGKLHQAQILGNLTLLESPFFLNREPQAERVLKAIVDRLPDGDCRSYWRAFLDKADVRAEMEAMGPANRLDDLIQPVVFRRMLGQDTESVDFLDIMNSGKIAIFDTSIGKDTEITADGQALFNALIVQSYRQAFPRRTRKDDRAYDPRTTPPHTIIMDEFGEYCTTEFARMLTAASKFGLRCVFSHQNLQQLIPPDGDKQLYNAVLAIPNKVVFGNLPFEEAEELAKHIHLADLNPDEIKYQGETVQWDPVLKWGVTARTTAHSSGTAHMRGAGVGSGASSGTSLDPQTGRQVDHATASDHAEAHEADTDSEIDTEAVTEGLYTDHVKRIKKDPPIYRRVEEQVFKAAQTLSTNAVGVAVIGTEKRKPTLCSFPNMDPRPVTEAQRTQFLSDVYDKPVYLPVALADRLIAERQVKLIEEAKPFEQPKQPRTAEKKKRTDRKPRFPT